MLPSAQKVTLVCDNLNTHPKGALYTTFSQKEFRRLANKSEIRHTPKTGARRLGQHGLQKENSRQRATATRT